MSCGCITVVGDEPFHLLAMRIQTARKPHRCTECHRRIGQGEKYEYFRGVLPGEKPETFKTCGDCLAIRKEFFCGSFCYGTILEDLRYHIGDIDGQISSDCLTRLPERARSMVFDLIDETFAHEEIFYE